MNERSCATKIGWGARRGIALSPVVMALGCGGATQEPAAAVPSPLVEATPPGSSGEPDSVEPSEPLAPPSEPPPLQVFAPVPLPFDPDAVLVFQPRLGLSVVLFADERQAVRAHVATSLAKLGHAVAPLEQLEQIEVAAAEGRLVLEDDRRCVAPLLPQELLGRYFGSQPRADLSASCLDECRLQVDIEDPRDRDGAVSYRSDRIRKAHDPNAWTRARLRPSDTWGGLVGGTIGSSMPSPIEFSMLETTGPWARSPEGWIARAEQSVSRCAHDVASVRISYEVLLEVGRDGQVARCEVNTEDSMAPSQHQECLCEGIETAAFARGPAGRRLRVEATDRGQGRVHRLALRPLQPQTQPWAERLLQAQVLTRCNEHLPPKAELSATASLTLTPEGRVEQVQIHGDIDTTAEMKFSACLVQHIKAVPMPCAPPGIDTLQVSIHTLDNQ